MMETRSIKRLRLWFGENYTTAVPVDRLSDLPDPILHHILLLLPIQSVAQTCILSKRWRSLWHSFPDLDFTSIGSDSTPMSQVLTLRDKNSDLRSLRFRARLSFSGFNGLIRSAIRHNVQELDAEVETDDYFNFPRGVITSESLRVFRLKSRYPGFRLPPSSVMKGGFRFLQTLSLSFVILYGQSSLVDLFTESSFPSLKNLSLDGCVGMTGLKVSCRGLEDLRLENCAELQSLEVDCGRLEKLRVVKCFDGYYDKSWVKVNGELIRRVDWENNAITGTTCLENLRSVEEVSVEFSIADKVVVGVEKLGSVCDLMAGLSQTRSLLLHSQCIQVMSSKNYSSHVVLPFENLKKLELHTLFNKNIIPGLAFLFRNTPSLHTLNLNILNDLKLERRRWNKELWDLSNSEEEQYWESQMQPLKPFLSSIKIVKIEGFVECEDEVSLAKFLLKHAKDLQEMTLSSPYSNNRDSLRRHKIRSQMIGFSGASSTAKIAFQ